MNEEYLKRLMVIFQEEAEEHLKIITIGLVEYEKCSDDNQKVQIIEPVYRATHSLKGASRAVDLLIIEKICQNIENVFAGFKEQRIKESTSLFDNLHKGIDLISDFLASNEEKQKAEISNEMENIINIINEQIVNE